MTLLEQLNCKCDSLAKLALVTNLERCDDPSLCQQQLPFESAAVFYKGKKIRGDCGAEIWFQVGRKEARSFYLNELGWLAATFDSVDWEARDKVLASKPDMFRLWLCKQTSSFCATGKNMGRWFGSEVTCCPNCHAPDEDALHLLHCPDHGRQDLFRSEVESLHSWLRDPHTHPSLATMIHSYISHQGSRPMADFAPCDPVLQRLASSQDVLGWDNFMEGKLSVYFASIQRDHLLLSPSCMVAEDWMSQFITRILHITHGQWLYRNISRHHRQHGLLEEADRTALLREIDRYMNVHGLSKQYNYDQLLVFHQSSDNIELAGMNNENDESYLKTTEDCQKGRRC